MNTNQFLNLPIEIEVIILNYVNSGIMSFVCKKWKNINNTFPIYYNSICTKNLINWTFNIKSDNSIIIIISHILVKNKSFKLVKHILKKGIVPDDYLIYKSLSYLSFMKYLWKNHKANFNNYSVKLIKRGDIKTLHWFKKKKIYIDHEICNLAIMFNQLDVLIWARENEYNWDNDTFKLSIIYGDLEILDYLILSGLTCDTLASLELARKGDKEKYKLIANYVSNFNNKDVLYFANHFNNTEFVEFINNYRY